MKKNFKLSALLLALAMIFCMTACEKEPENMENWSLPGVAEEIKFNGEKVILPLSIEEFGEKYTISEENLRELPQGESMKVSEISYDGSAFASVMSHAYYGKKIDDSRPIFFYEFTNYTILDNFDNKFQFPEQAVPPDISINGLNFSSTADDVKKVMGEPIYIDGVAQFTYPNDIPDEEIEQSVYFSFNDDGKMTSILIYFSSDVLYASDNDNPPVESVDSENTDDYVEIAGGMYKKDITELTLYCEEDCSIENINQLESIEKLAVYSGTFGANNIKLSGIESLVKLKNLKVLHLGTSIDGDISVLGNLENLEEFQSL